MSQSQHNWGKESHNRTVGDWVDEHGLESWILPLRTRKEDPLEITRQVKTRLDSLPKTQSTLTFQNLGFDQLADQYKSGIMRLFLLRECEHIKKTRFLNPDYMHYGHTLDPVTDIDERMDMFETFRDSPWISREWLSAQWGTNKSAVSNFLRRRDVYLKDIRKENRARYGRTLATLQAWGYSIMDLARLLPGNTRTIRYWKNYHAENEGYEPPSRPTDEPWYNSHLKVSELK